MQVLREPRIPVGQQLYTGVLLNAAERGVADRILSGNCPHLRFRDLKEAATGQFISFVTWTVLQIVADNK